MRLGMRLRTSPGVVNDAPDEVAEQTFRFLGVADAQLSLYVREQLTAYGCLRPLAVAVVAATAAVRSADTRPRLISMDRVTLNTDVSSLGLKHRLPSPVLTRLVGADPGLTC
jgi:hypothetical protein